MHIYIYINCFSSLYFYTNSEKFSHLPHLTLTLEHQPCFLILSKVPRTSSMSHDSSFLVSPVFTWQRQSFPLHLLFTVGCFTPRHHQAAPDFPFTFSNFISSPECLYLAPLTNEAAVFPALCSFCCCCFSQGD